MHIVYPEMDLTESWGTQEDSTSLSDALSIRYLGSDYYLQNQILLRFMISASRILSF